MTISRVVKLRPLFQEVTLASSEAQSSVVTSNLHETTFFTPLFYWPKMILIVIEGVRIDSPIYGCLTSSAVPGVPCYIKCWVQSAGTWSAMFLSAVTVSAGYQECCPLSAALFLQVLLVFSEKNNWSSLLWTEGWECDLGFWGWNFLPKMVWGASWDPTGRYSTMEPSVSTFRG